MAFNIIALKDIISSDSTEDEVHKLLLSFSCSSLKNGASDVEDFLHSKAVQFEKLDISRTYLVMATHQKIPFIAGYFSISNKPLIISKKNYDKISTNFQKKLMGIGHKTEQANYECKGYLLGQLGKNYKEDYMKKSITGGELLQLAYSKIKEAHNIVGGRILHLECEKHDKITNFYNSNGFRELVGYDSPNGLCMYVKLIKDL